MISEIIGQVCGQLSEVLGSIPFVGDTVGQVCSWLVSLFEGLGL